MKCAVSWTSSHHSMHPRASGALQGPESWRKFGLFLEHFPEQEVTGLHLLSAQKGAGAHFLGCLLLSYILFWKTKWKYYFFLPVFCCFLFLFDCLLACFLALENLGLWEDVRRIVLGSELVTGFPWTFKVPGLPQYLQSLTKLSIPEVWASLAEAEGQAVPVPLSFPRLLESSFPEVRLLTLETLLEKAASSELEEKGPHPLLCNMGEEFLLLAMKENHPGCFCRVESLLHWHPSVSHVGLETTRKIKMAKASQASAIWSNRK